MARPGARPRFSARHPAGTNRRRRSLLQRTAILVFSCRPLCWVGGGGGIQINAAADRGGLPAIARIFFSMAPDAQWL